MIMNERLPWHTQKLSELPLLIIYNQLHLMGIYAKQVQFHKFVVNGSQSHVLRARAMISNLATFLVKVKCFAHLNEDHKRDRPKNMSHSILKGGFYFSILHIDRRRRWLC